MRNNAATIYIWLDCRATIYTIPDFYYVLYTLANYYDSYSSHNGFINIQIKSIFPKAIVKVAIITRGNFLEEWQAAFI